MQTNKLITYSSQIQQFLHLLSSVIWAYRASGGQWIGKDWEWCECFIIEIN